MFLLNAFSLQMLQGDALADGVDVRVQAVDNLPPCEDCNSRGYISPASHPDRGMDWAEWETCPACQGSGIALQSAIGHADTAAVLGVPMARINVTLKKGDVAYVAQLQGGRLPEGATTLPEGFSFRFLRVEVR